MLRYLHVPTAFIANKPNLCFPTTTPHFVLAFANLEHTNAIKRLNLREKTHATMIFKAIAKHFNTYKG